MNPGLPVTKGVIFRYYMILLPILGTKGIMDSDPKNNSRDYNKKTKWKNKSNNLYWKRM